MNEETHMNAVDLVTPEKIQERIDSWDARDWDGIRANYFEYQAAMGDEATKTLKEFAWGISAQNCLFSALTQESK